MASLINKQTSKKVAHALNTTNMPLFRLPIITTPASVAIDG